MVIPRSCSCTWTLARTDPATWRLAKADPGCKVHGAKSGEAK